jgi:hypothetical protein
MIDVVHEIRVHSIQTKDKVKKFQISTFSTIVLSGKIPILDYRKGKNI